jgi:hypothetical protein
VAWFGGNRGSAIGDREALAAFLDEEAEAFARGTVDDYTRSASCTIPTSCLPSRHSPPCSPPRGPKPIRSR